MKLTKTFSSPARLLMGPGPSNVAPSVLKAMYQPLIGHLDPVFISMMEEIKEMLRAVFQTSNEMTFPVSGTGSAGMEFCFMNLIEADDEVIIGVNGVFGNRMCEVAKRCGAKVHKVESDWGEIIRAEQIEAALKHIKPKLVAIVHAETSTGALTPLSEISKLTHDAGALFLVDAVTSLGGCPVKVDEWEIDAIYSGTQKCLSCPPGLSPVSLSSAAMECVRNRITKPRSWYLDINLLSAYWGEARTYHHTAPVSMNFALHEALRLILKEGLEARWKRHCENHLRLKSGLSSLGLKIASQKGHGLWQLNSIAVPEKIDEAKIRQRLLTEHEIEIGAGLGPLSGKIWRIGLMGESSKSENVDHLLDAIKMLLDNS